MPVRSSIRHSRPARQTLPKAALALAACLGLIGTAAWADTSPAAPAQQQGQAEGAEPTVRETPAVRETEIQEPAVRETEGRDAAAQAPAGQDEAAAPDAAGQPAAQGENAVTEMSAADAAAAREAALKAISTTIKQSFGKRFPGLAIGEVAETPFSGVYEIPVQGELFYVDATGRYVLQGSLIDLETRTDLTAERMAKLTAVPFEELPLESAVKQVRGTGERKIAIFEDPNCGYCKQFHRTLERFDDITIYSVMFPILAPDSREKAENIMCAKDSVATLRAWMLDGKTPPKATCDTNIDELLAFGKQHNVRGTPAVFFEDGSRVGGAMTFDQLTRRLADLKKQP